MGTFSHHLPPQAAGDAPLFPGGALLAGPHPRSVQVFPGGVFARRLAIFRAPAAPTRPSAKPWLPAPPSCITRAANRHHLEYWIDYQPGGDHTMNGMPMPKKSWWRCCATAWPPARPSADAYTRPRRLRLLHALRDHYLIHPTPRPCLSSCSPCSRTKARMPPLPHPRPRAGVRGAYFVYFARP